MHESYAKILAARRDLASSLVHFTRKNEKLNAYEVLIKIIEELKLDGSSKFIKNKSKCVCFSEAPLAEHISYFNLANINPDVLLRYEPFGIMIDKKKFYKKGGRPVIYQSVNELSKLDDSIKHKHVTFDPGSEDFTWEREWRIKADVFEFSRDEIHVLVPNNEYFKEMFDRFSEIESGYDANPDGDDFVYDSWSKPFFDLKVINLEALGLIYE